MQKFIQARALIYRKFGDPREVLELETINVSADPGREECLIEWLASPINPLDINTFGFAFRKFIKEFNMCHLWVIVFSQNPGQLRIKIRATCNRRK